MTAFIVYKRNTIAGDRFSVYKGYSTMKGLSFSLKRAVGISGLKTKVARKTGLPTTKQGLERKIGQAVISTLTGKKRK